jgi:hypothetical protein
MGRAVPHSPLPRENVCAQSPSPDLPAHGGARALVGLREGWSAHCHVARPATGARLVARLHTALRRRARVDRLGGRGRGRAEHRRRAIHAQACALRRWCALPGPRRLDHLALEQGRSHHHILARRDAARVCGRRRRGRDVPRTRQRAVLESRDHAHHADVSHARRWSDLPAVAACRAGHRQPSLHGTRRRSTT